MTSKIAKVFDKSSPSTRVVITFICSRVNETPKAFNFLFKSNSNSLIKEKLDAVLISCDYELIDYTNSYLNAKNYRNEDGTEIFSLENNTIDNIYHKSENIRLGIEMKVDPFSLRAGYARNSSPFKDNDELSRENFSFGAGVNYNSYYFDFAYVLSQGHDQYQMYGEQFVNPTGLVYTNHNLVITLGFRY